MSRFDFDAQIDRRDVPSLKTHRNVLGDDGADLFAAGVADMDFQVAPPITAALLQRLGHAGAASRAIWKTASPGSTCPSARFARTDPA